MSKIENDIELVNRVKSGDTSAFDFLVIKYQRRVIRLLSRIVRDPVEVEDIAQESFLKAYRAIEQFRGDSAFYTWLYRIAVNTARNTWVVAAAATRRRPPAARTAKRGGSARSGNVSGSESLHVEDFREVSSTQALKKRRRK